MTSSIDIHTLNKMLGAGDAPVLLDVRRRADYEATPQKITGATWCDPENIDRWVKDLPSGRPIVLYCVKGGSVSQSVVDRLRREGLDALMVEGGLKAWIENGQPVQAVLPKPYTIHPADVDRLRQAGVSEADIDHSVKVAEKALEIAGRIRADLDMELVGRGALFHDLGKARTHEIEHGKVGAEMGSALGLPEAVTAVMEKHIRGGLTAEEAVELGLPVKDYTLGTLEERIIIYADRLVDIITDGIVAIKSEKEAEDRFEEILQSIPKYGKNDRTLERYLGYHREIQGRMSD
ncbi:HDIG domain-containing metalloprotein [Desulfosarcina sp.]|uniref:HDIG domain-containing metalloprotein n=1 Tax=Desulfosarcina sp. TaxID=2027861 RepID=UPI00356A24ED